jgi:hypothetical protein
VTAGVRIFLRSKEKMPEDAIETREVVTEITVTSAVDVNRVAVNGSTKPPIETET